MEDIKEKTKQKTTPHELKNLKKWKNEKQANLKDLCDQLLILVT